MNGRVNGLCCEPHYYSYLILPYFFGSKNLFFFARGVKVIRSDFVFYRSNNK